VVNRDLRANFTQETLAFEPRWDDDAEWMDIGFRSLEPQRVRVDELEVDVELAADERLRIEISTKFRRDGIEHELASAGLRAHAYWTDQERRFALILARRMSR